MWGAQVRGAEGPGLIQLCGVRLTRGFRAQGTIEACAFVFDLILLDS